MTPDQKEAYSKAIKELREDGAVCVDTYILLNRVGLSAAHVISSFFERGGI